jgi:hypothetical protein
MKRSSKWILPLMKNHAALGAGEYKSSMSMEYLSPIRTVHGWSLADISDALSISRIRRFDRR